MDRLLRYVCDIERATFFDIQNVGSYYWSYPEDRWDNQRDFSVAPPFDFFATKYTLPDSLPDEFRGLDIMTVFRAVEQAPRQMQTYHVDATGGFNPQPPHLVVGAKWHLLISIYAADGREILPATHWFMAIDERGRIADYGDHPALWFVGHEATGQVGIVVDSFLQVSLLALTFLHSKNVEIVPPPAPTKKRLPRKVKFESRYHRLKVNAIGGERRSAAGQGGESGIRQGLHIVRGAFRHYGPAEIHGHPDGRDRGLLFGRLAGRFWVAAHAKGDEQLGQIEKDYKIK